MKATAVSLAVSLDPPSSALTTLVAVVEACPNDTGWQLSTAASEYSKLAGLLAGFAFTALVFILREEASTAYARSVEVLIYAFVGLVLTSVSYAIIAGEEERYGGGRIVSEGLFAGVAFALSGLLLIYAIVLLLEATQVARGKDEGDGDGEGPFGRVARHLAVIAATFITTMLLFLVALGGVTYADTSNGNQAVAIVAWSVVGVQCLVALSVAVAYLRNHKMWGRRRKRETGQEVSWYASTALGLVFAATVACHVTGSIPNCDQAPAWSIILTLSAYGVATATAAYRLAGPWLGITTGFRD